jgi:mono/diheme cytochrome c family protein
VRSSHRGTVLWVAGLLLAGTTLAAQSTSVWSGVYTTEQATAGEKIYFERCASCHGDDLAGRERAPALAGTQFLEAWHGRNLRRLVERIEEMPPGAPVSSADAVTTLAFLLYSSEMPSGSTVLPADRAKLAEITFERRGQ